MNATKVAIIGAGPRGLWATEELCAQARAHRVPLDVEVWDPAPPGAGAAYAPGQPEHWTLNVSSHIVGTGLGSFDRWRLQHGEAEPLDPFPPRSRVGEFLGESWRALIEHPSPWHAVRHVPRAAGSLERRDGGWLIDGEAYAEVLVATGHAATWPGALPRTPRVLGVYPTGQLDPVAPGARVAVRGTALTFIDAALDLTLGRGGSFAPAADHGHDLAYRPSGREPTAIVPVGRSGRFMEVKPDPRGALAELRHKAALAEARPRVLLSPDLAALTDALADYAAALLEAAGVPGDHSEGIRAVIEGRDWTPGADPVAALRRSRDVAVGEAAPGPAWAVAQALRQLYPEVVRRVADPHRARVVGFEDLARTLERVAFGTIPGNASRLLALIDAGVVDTRHLTRPEAWEEAEIVVDAVLPPAGLVEGTLLASYLGDEAPHLVLEPDGSLPRHPGLAVAGRDVEHLLPGADTLSREIHDVIPRWARGLVARHRRTAVGTPRAAATVPLTGRCEPWMVELLESPERCAGLIKDHGSPVNVHHPAPVLRNIEELICAGRDCGVDVRVFLARKANKTLRIIDAVRNAGHGVDVASERELTQVLGRGVPGDRIILSAAIKPDSLLERAVRAGVAVSADSPEEADRLAAIAAGLGHSARVAPRLAPDPAVLPPTRFGARAARWRAWLDAHPAGPQAPEVVGVHVHLHGYRAEDRRVALGEALGLIDHARAAGHAPSFIDLGGGVPMSYLDDPAQWEAFLRARAALPQAHGEESFTWKNDPLTTVYPFHQNPTRGQWLREVLTGPVEVHGEVARAADALTSRGLRLHLEPGRSVLDGAGLTLARVSFLKERSDGTPLVGLDMNRTQCRTTADDILVDPLLIPCASGAGQPDRPAGYEGFLVGAYCIEDEVIVRRRVRFSHGISVGDVIALPNTGGYFMHILESASHQIPLATNLATAPGAESGELDFEVDPIDLP
ncbi:FAD/NAD(P)-binding protein [Corynebacterium mastitidis]|uniref:FAD/NAD(P)-binding protein n=1 Tax=Corynebacterium mastitidis TaxID=161890 RepID=UPI00036FBD5E|nr:FAD/NAD(P)-binding protein [Corynebacterium mastitidis]